MTALRHSFIAYLIVPIRGHLYKQGLTIANTYHVISTLVDSATSKVNHAIYAYLAFRGFDLFVNQQRMKD